MIRIPGDDELVRAALAGDKACFIELVRRHGSRSLAAALAILENYHDAEDAVQDGTLTAFKNLRHLEDPFAFRTWFLRIVANRAKDMRRQRRVVESLDDVDEPSAGHDVLGRLVVAEAFASLPHKARTVAILYFSGLSTKEIAGVLGRPVGTVRRQLGEARHALAAFLDSEGGLT